MVFRSYPNTDSGILLEIFGKFITIMLFKDVVPSSINLSTELIEYGV
jgi:hypothetical protein